MGEVQRRKRVPVKPAHILVTCSAVGLGCGLVLQGPSFFFGPLPFPVAFWELVLGLEAALLLPSAHLQWLGLLAALTLPLAVLSMVSARLERAGWGEGSG